MIMIIKLEPWTSITSSKANKARANKITLERGHEYSPDDGVYKNVVQENQTKPGEAIDQHQAPQAEWAEIWL